MVSGSQVTFNLGHDALDLQAVVAAMEHQDVEVGHPSNPLISQDWSLSMSSLHDVFVRLAMEAEGSV